MCDYWNIREKAVGGNQLNLSATIIKDFKIQVPEITEQYVIVKSLDRILNHEKCVLESSESVLDKIDTMKKSILARAFRGELGTNDPSDEPAIELLKTVLQEQG